MACFLIILFPPYLFFSGSYVLEVGDTNGECTGKFSQKV
ncbi:hypothetical protein B4166_3033 [Caldibacillus thermoamylovorans]|uniref:Secreted protein n=1 Tax=Caldibacillus thermoamylovorans TaxID=35841 RepID=A0ABD4A6J8_9BACI|nr:hypothetical protein B4166_3033 [Caldibacillus thermoamylovorans]KIO72404.1 hypothetical protein B4167_1094 [Caldibacillus thermoamylovorans]